MLAMDHNHLVSKTHLNHTESLKSPSPQSILISTFSQSPSTHFVTCQICTNFYTPQFLQHPLSCHDQFCSSCLVEYIKIHIQESNVLIIPCPNHNCPKIINDQTVQSLVTEDLYNKYLLFKRKQELLKTPNVRLCPKENCNGFSVRNKQDHVVICKACSFEYCFYCSEPSHSLRECKKQEDKDFDVWAKKNKMKYCPSCRNWVEKANGCDHMTCINCKYEWCWLCGEKYEYNHIDYCEVFRLQKWDPPMWIVLLLLFFSLSFMLFPLARLVYYIRNEADLHINSSLLRKLVKFHYLSYPVASLFGIIFIPWFLVLAPFGMSYLLFYVFFDTPQTSRVYKFAKSGLCGILASPVCIMIYAAAFPIMHMIGFGLLMAKVYYFFKRFKNPQYMRPATYYAAY